MRDSSFVRPPLGALLLLTLSVAAIGVARAVLGTDASWPTTLGWSALCLAAAATVVPLYLRAVCLGAPSPGDLKAASVRLLLPVAGAGVATWAGLAAVPIALSIGAAIGITLALLRLRAHLPATAETSASGALRAWIVIGSLALITAVSAGRHRAALLAPLHEAESAAVAAGQADAYRWDGPIRLNAGNTHAIRGPYRDFRLDAVVELESEAALEIRVRAPSTSEALGRSARGVSLLLSADPDLETGFFRAETEAFERLDRPPPTAVLAAGRLEIELVAEGRSFEARLDGRRLAQVSTPRHPTGEIVLLAARGAVRLESLTVEPSSSMSGPPTGIGAVGWASATPVTVLLLLAAVFAALLRLPLRSTLEMLSFAAVPFALGLASLDLHAPPNVTVVMATSGAILLVLLLPALTHPRAVTPVRLLILGAFAITTTLFALSILRDWDDSDPDPQALNEMSFVEWSGDRIADRMLYLRHPLLRRWNFSLTEHRFRGRSFDVPKPPGMQRVISLGGSSTWGLGIPEESNGDYPQVLESLLRDDGLDVEVLNAAVPGSIGGRLFRILRDGLASFEPDVVTLSLTFNDSVILSATDEERYFERITRPDFTRTRLGQFKERFAQEQDRAFAGELFERFRAGEPLPPWPEDRGPTPPQRFERALRRFAALARERDFRLILVKEPVRGDERWIWKEELYGTIDLVAAEYGLPVVDPRPLLAERGGAALFLDVVHPTAEGARVMAEALLPAVREALPDH